MEGFVNDHKKETLSQAWQVDKDLKACLKELYDKKLWTDVKIHCKDHIDGECILAHKVVLAARSPVFQSMFFGTCADGKDEIYLDQVDANIFNLFLRYLYSDDLTLSEENASSVLEIAHFYQVLNLVDVCADFLATIITAKNAFEVLNVATFYELTTLRNACYAFIDTHADEILQSEAFLQLSADRVHYILKGDTFYTDEKIIFTKVIQWAKRKLFEEGKKECTGAEIRSILGATFYLLRLPTMAYETLMECIRKKGYLSIDEYEEIIDFINGIPLTSVKSNSCVKRIPREETLILSTMDGTYSIGNSVSTSFEMSVSRDVILTKFVLSKISNIFQYNHQLFSAENSRKIPITHPSINSFFKEYEGNALVLTYPNQKQVHTLQKVGSKILSVELEIPISVHFTIKGKKRQELEKAQDIKSEKSQFNPVDNTDELGKGKLHGLGIPSLNVNTNDSIKDSGTEKKDSGAGSEDSGDKDKLLYEQDYMCLPEDISQSTIHLTRPFRLSKQSSPYTIEMGLKLCHNSCIKIKAVCSKDWPFVRSKHGQVTVRSICNQFAGIQSLWFENISQRESNEHT